VSRRALEEEIESFMPLVRDIVEGSSQAIK